MSDVGTEVGDDLDDDLDGCDMDFAEAAEDDNTAALRQLFPDGVADEDKAEAYRGLAGAPVEGDAV